MTDNPEPYGFSDDELAAQPTAFRDGLFRDQVVVVSGGATGLGKAIASLFARLGAKLVICGRSAEKLEAARPFFARFDTPLMCHPMSIRDADCTNWLVSGAGT